MQKARAMENSNLMSGGQKGLKKHTDGRKEGATLLLLLSTPGVDFEGGGTRFFPSVLEPSFDAKPAKGSTLCGNQNFAARSC